MKGKKEGGRQEEGGGEDREKQMGNGTLRSVAALAGVLLPTDHCKDSYVRYL